MTTQPAPAHRDGTVERTADGGVIRFERHLHFPIAEVWDAITNPTRLADWWLPMDADITVDLRTGGEMRFEIGGDEPIAWDWDAFAAAQAHYAASGLAPGLEAG